ncbi:MAG: PPOX class F420-dependent oxidoreductase [Gammaproteobacteria bacterium]|jgi:PPOX class probable F420-dependent enzyme|nr:PPOX class F420-dependent oxidoreductase [Gammaproteobacteria bacterium]
MTASIPESHRDLLDGPVYVQMASYMKDGSIQVNPVWCSFDGEHILINSALGRVKDKNLRANPTITILAMDPENPYRWLEVRGTVDEITEEGADQHIDDLAELYINQRPYPFRQEGEVRVIYKIKPLKVQAFAS